MSISRLLLVDDNVQSLKLLKAIYDAEGYEIITANDGKEAIDILLVNRIDLVVTDILMPNIDGYYLCYKIRTNKNLQNIPIVIYTATYTSSSEEKLAHEMGADVFIRKPATRATLVNAVRETLANPKNSVLKIFRTQESFEMMHQYSSELVTKLEQRNIELEQTTDSLRKAETNYREIFDKANDAIYIHEIETGKLLETNQRASEITGYSKKELLHGDPADFITDNPNFSLEKALELLKKAEYQPQLFEWLGKNKNGSYTWLEVNLKKATLAGEERILSFFREINDRKKNEEKIQSLNEDLEQKVIERTRQLELKIRQLEESEEKFQKAFQASAAGITITRLSDSAFIEVNDSFIAITGFSKEELIGHTSTELGLIVDLKKRREIFSQIKEQGSAKQFEMEVRNKIGRMLHVLASVETIILNGEKFAINIIYDITERKNAERQLEALNKELEAFSYSVSHDLRAPLRSLSGYSKILEEDHHDKLDAEGKRVLDIIHRNTIKMNNLIDCLLEFSKLGRKDLQKLEIDTKKIVLNILKEGNSSVQHKAAIEIVDPLLPVYADQELLTQVWINLISNALKYSSKKENPKIEIGCQKETNEIVFYVKDNGAGFDMQYADKLFGIFQRLHKAKEFEGTGVGLSIVKRIITKHGGRVWAEGKVNVGAAFYFSIPNMN